MGHFSENGLHCELMREDKITSIQFPVKVLLMGLGEDINREGIIKTPLRVAKALCEGTKGYWQSAKEIVEGALFPEDGTKIGHAGGVGGLVIVRNLDFYSYCESCMLPFFFKCHVGYVPSSQRVLGLSKLSRVTNVFAKRFQEPHRLADEVCSALHQGINPEGVAVVLQCSHINLPETESNILDSKHKGLNEILVSSGSVFLKTKMQACGMTFLAFLNLEVSFNDKEVYLEFNLPFWSQCEHHLLPFYGVVHIGYFIYKGFHPIQKSILQSIVHFYGVKLQVQERLTKQIAETISPLIGGNVIVVVEASHTCMMSRGIEKFGSNTATIAVLGCFSTDLAARTSFLESIPRVISLEEH
ncbi:hypothetical protein VNO78_24288 [Psophocarpus tetragonolobus]|uniref:GTP cyclohydrolase 1 n=1 Tax=Psophocarpus tetragonolobus TaxID=3891 RepID=A0AAN9XEK7_PSOTE